jgi:hypothetical protein
MHPPSGELIVVCVEADAIVTFVASGASTQIGEAGSQLVPGTSTLTITCAGGSADSNIHITRLGKTDLNNPLQAAAGLQKSSSPWLIADCWLLGATNRIKSATLAGQRRQRYEKSRGRPCV